MRRSTWGAAGIALLASIVALSVSGCELFVGSGAGRSGRIDLSSLSRLLRFEGGSLERYSGMDDLAADLDSYGYEIATMYLRDRTAAYGLGYYPWRYVDGPVAMASDAEGSGGDYATNVQIAGVDEMDSVKSDGTLVFIAAGSTLVVTDAEGTMRDEVAVFEGRDIEGLIVDGDRILAVSGPATGGWPWPYYAATLDLAFAPSAARSSTELALFSYDSLGKLEPVERATVGGACEAGRSAGGFAYLAFADDLDYSVLIDGLMEVVPFDDASSYEESLQKVRGRLETLIPEWREAVLADLFGEDSAASEIGAAATLRLVDIRDGSDSFSAAEPYRSYTSLIALSLRDGLAPTGRGGLFSTTWSYSSDLYSDGSAAVLANRAYSDREGAWAQTTQLYAFRTEGGSIEPWAVGAVPGHPLNQFSLDLRGGYLRVATWSSAAWVFADGRWAAQTQSQSRVSVLSTDAPAMSVVGSVEGIGGGESLYAVRFVGDLGLVVTFRQTDPLFVVDLSDPLRPILRGELQVSGYSTYLHPLEGGRVLAVGQEGSSLQVSIFDVSDPDAPALSGRYLFGSYSWSEAGYDHHAFRYLADRGELVVPVSSWGGEYRSGFAVLDVSAEGPSLRGMADFGAAEWSPSANVPPRSLLLGDTLVAARGGLVAGLRLSDLQRLWYLSL